MVLTVSFSLYFYESLCPVLIRYTTSALTVTVTLCAPYTLYYTLSRPRIRDWRYKRENGGGGTRACQVLEVSVARRGDGVRMVVMVCTALCEISESLALSRYTSHSLNQNIAQHEANQVNVMLICIVRMSDTTHIRTYISLLHTHCTVGYMTCQSPTKSWRWRRRRQRRRRWRRRRS